MKVWEGVCCEACWNAEYDRCTCKCGGVFHGQGVKSMARKRKPRLKDRLKDDFAQQRRLTWKTKWKSGSYKRQPPTTTKSYRWTEESQTHDQHQRGVIDEWNVSINRSVAFSDLASMTHQSVKENNAKSRWQHESVERSHTPKRTLQPLPHNNSCRKQRGNRADRGSSRAENAAERMDAKCAMTWKFTVEKRTSKWTS